MIRLDLPETMTGTRFYYDSGSLHIDGYDSIHDPLPAALIGDVAFYAGLIQRSGQPALEIGCGTGRVAASLAANGIEIVGIDIAEGMLASARAKRDALPPPSRARLDLRRADMRDFALDRLFDTVIVPFRTFHLLLTSDEQLSCLAAIHRHMRPGAHLAIHLFNPPADIVERAKQPLLASERGISASTGRRIVASSGPCSVDAARQIRHEIWHYRELDEKGTALREQRLELAVRWFWPEQMQALLEQAGFAVVSQHGDFTGGKLRPGGEQIWIAARR
jgi:SAM-dependent methyltransferase